MKKEKVLLLDKGNIMVNFDRLEMNKPVDLMYIWYGSKIVANLDVRKYKIKFGFTGTAGTVFFRVTKKRCK